MQLGNCKNCKHYEVPDFWPVKSAGLCQAIYDYSKIKDDGLLNRAYGDDEFGNLHVGENFGCIHFEQK